MNFLKMKLKMFFPMLKKDLDVIMTVKDFFKINKFNLGTEISKSNSRN